MAFHALFPLKSNRQCLEFRHRSHTKGIMPDDCLFFRVKNIPTFLTNPVIKPRVILYAYKCIDMYINIYAYICTLTSYNSIKSELGINIFRCTEPKHSFNQQNLYLNVIEKPVFVFTCVYISVDIQ